jgi:hypothetical protein
MTSFLIAIPNTSLSVHAESPVLSLVEERLPLAENTTLYISQL